MKTLIKNILATTGLTLLALGAVAATYGGNYLFIRSVFESLLANALIHIGLLLISKLENRYYFLEIFFEVGYVYLILIPAGYLFDWYSSTPMWVILLMGVLIYACGCLISIFRVTSDVKEINRHIKAIKKEKESLP